MHIRRPLALLALLLVVIVTIALLLFWIAGGGREDEQHAADPNPTENGSSLSAEASGVRPEDQQPEAADGTEPREQLGRVVLTCLVKDSQGAPIKGALVTWSPTRATPRMPIPPLTEFDANALLDRTVSAKTNVDGIAEFDQLPEFAKIGPSVIWASGLDHLSDFELLERVEGGQIQAPVLVLANCGRYEVRVVDGEDRPVPGARVLQRGVPLSEARIMFFRGALPDSSEEARTRIETATGAYCREYLTDKDGRIDIEFALWPSAIWARKGSDMTRFTLVRPEREHVVLRLGAPLSASGTVAMANGGVLPADLGVLCTWVAGGPTSFLGRCPVRGDGSWGPHTIPARAEGTYRFRLLGGGVTIQDEMRSAPVESGTLKIDFAAEIGVRQEVLVQDDQSDPIADALVEIIWKQEDAWPRSLAWTNQDGLAPLEGCKPTTIWLRASKGGYIEKTEANVSIPRPVEEMVIVLAKASRLSGIVTCDGKPVTDFQVITWSSHPLESDRAVFADRKDGRFLIESVQTGTVRVMATRADLPESELHTVEVEPGGEAEVEIELKPGTIGTGLVVEAATGNPCPGASVQLQACFQTHTLGPRGAPHLVESDGTFTLSGVSSHESSVLATCPGYVSAYSTGKMRPDGMVDFGVLTLGRRGILEVDLLGGELDEETTVWFSARGRFGENVPETVMPRDGHLEVADVAPGRYMVYLLFQDASLQEQKVHLIPGTPWRIGIPFEAGHSVVATLQAPSGEAVPPAEVWATWRSGDGAHHRRAAVVGEDGSVTMTHMPTGSVFFTVYDIDSRVVLATRRETLSPPSPQAVDLTLTNRGVRVLVVDRDGQPRIRARAYVASSDPQSRWTEFSDVDSQGVFVHRGLDCESVIVCAYEAGVGFAREEVRLSGDDLTDVEIVVGDGDEMRVIASDHDVNVEGVKLLSVPADLVHDEVHFDRTNADGQMTWPNVAHGDYTIHLSRYGYWPATHTVHFEGQSPIQLPIRRRGKLEATITRSSSTPIPGAQLRLHSVEFETSVSDWLATGQLEASAVQLQADGQGRVFVHGIPHGTYSWTATGPDGASSSGQLVVPPGATLETALVVGNP